jgi:2-iminobutanoate/2-iminopropanoate deaminase
MSQKIISTIGAPAAIGPYSQAVQAGGFLYISGQIPLDPQTMKLVEGDIQVQTNRVFDNLEAILTEAGATLNNAVKVEVYLDDMNDFKAVNEVYGQRFGDHKPARQAVEVARLPIKCQIEISLIAYLGE